MAELAGAARRLLGNVGELLGAGNHVHGGIGQEHRAPFGDHHGQPEDMLAGLGVEHPGDLFEGPMVVAGQPGDHGVAVA